jgi:hypothetical protein
VVVAQDMWWWLRRICGGGGAGYVVYVRSSMSQSLKIISKSLVVFI